MASPNILFYRSLDTTRVYPFNFELDVSQSLTDGTPLKYGANGKLVAISAQTDSPEFILNGPAQTSSTGSSVAPGAFPPVFNQIGNGFNATTGPGGAPGTTQLGGFADVLPALNGKGIWKVAFTPVFNKVTANTGNSSPTVITLPNSPYAYGANNFVGGKLFCNSLMQQSTITASAACAAGAALQLTVVSPFTQNGDGLVFSATPLGPLVTNAQWQNVSGTVAGDGFVPGQRTADLTSGKIKIHEVDLLNGYAYCIFQ